MEELAKLEEVRGIRGIYWMKKLLKTVEWK